MDVDLSIIHEWVHPGAHVLDVGCGDGSLLAELVGERGITGYGLEIDPIRISLCLERGVNVIEQDADQGLANFADASFDIVIMTQTLQAVRYPHLVLDEMLRIGRECIITFPNFAHWRCRTHLGGKGRMPVSCFMPYSWYDTPNIHFCTVLDFEALCTAKNLHVINRVVVDAQNRVTLATRTLPNLFGATAIYRVTR